MVDADEMIGSTAKGILIGLLSAFGSALVALLVISLVLFLRYTQGGQLLLDRIGRPGEYDDEQAFAREEEEALQRMDDLQRSEYLRAKAFIQANPPETMPTDISLSQFLAIQEKGVSAWEFEPEIEIANCFVEGRTEIEFFDSVCCVQSNLPVPKQNEVYYWEAKIFDKPDESLISVGMTTKPYPLFRLPGFHKTSVAYLSSGVRRVNQPFTSTLYGTEFVQGDVIGVGYRPRAGTIFFTRNGRKFDDVVHGMRSPNFFPTIGATGPCSVHVNFGQLGFVFIEANVKKWGLAPMTGSLAPPPPYGSEQGSILLESGRKSQAAAAEAAAAASAAGVTEVPSSTPSVAWWTDGSRQARTRSSTLRSLGMPGVSAVPRPPRSPAGISLAQLSPTGGPDGDGEQGPSGDGGDRSGGVERSGEDGDDDSAAINQVRPPTQAGIAIPPPEYSSPQIRPQSPDDSPSEDGEDTGAADSRRRGNSSGSGMPLIGPDDPPIPSYDAAIRESRRTGSA